MTVEKRCKHYVSEWVYHNDRIVDAVEDEPLPLFGSLEVAPDDPLPKNQLVQEWIRLMQLCTMN